MKTREEIITSMCYTWRHDYGLKKHQDGDFSDAISSGMTDRERQSLWNAMAQVFDNNIADELNRLHAANIDCIDHFNALKTDYDVLLNALKEIKDNSTDPTDRSFARYVLKKVEE